MSADEARFRAVFEAMYRPLLAYALRRVPDRDAAEEVVADTMMVAWRRLDELPEGEAGRAWLFGVARRVVANQRRSRRRRWRLVARLRRERPSEGAPVASDPRIAAALAELSESDREVLRLAAWDGLSHDEIAVVLGLSPSGVASRLQRARRRLAAALVALGVERTPPGKGGM